MKIGTLNFHRAHNYGAMLVTYALKTWLCDHGHEGVVIDYWPMYHSSRYDPSKHPMFERFVMEYLAPMGDVNDFYDVIIYGSDQIWRNFSRGELEFDRVYLGDETLRASRKIVYGASAMLETIDSAMLDIILAGLDAFFAISVREESLRDMLCARSKYPIHCVCDPTMLLDESKWHILATNRIILGEYLLVYNIQFPNAVWDIVGTITQKTDLPIYVIAKNGESVLRDKDGNVVRENIGPKEFLALVRDASFVYASSFHGVVFSIIFNRPFCTMWKTSGARIESLLRSLGLETRHIEHSSQIDFDSSIDWCGVREKMVPYIADSERFLLENLR